MGPVEKEAAKTYEATVDVTTVEYPTGRWGIPKAFVVVQFRCSVTGHALYWPDSMTFSTQLEAGRFAYATAMNWVTSRFA